jgi:AcrR family transcriptional regulator
MGRATTGREHSGTRTAPHSEIHRAAVELVGERGFDQVTVEQISDRAGVSVGTFLECFPTKESAVMTGAPPFGAEAIALFRAGNGMEGLYADLATLASSQIAERLDGDVDFVAAARIVMDVPALSHRALQDLAVLERRLAGLIAERLRVEVSTRRVQMAAATFMSAVRVALMRWGSHPSRIDLRNELRWCAAELDRDGVAAA